MRATIANMKAVEEKFGKAHPWHIVFAYSPYTGESCSANPADYWNVDDNVCLKDEDGNEMVLAREVTRIEEFDLDQEPSTF